MSIWMKHPKIDALIEVPDDAVLGHRRAGWEITDPPPPEPTAGDLEAAQAEIEQTNKVSGHESDITVAAVDERPTESTTTDDGNKE